MGLKTIFGCALATLLLAGCYVRVEKAELTSEDAGLDTESGGSGGEPAGGAGAGGAGVGGAGAGGAGAGGAGVGGASGNGSVLSYRDAEDEIPACDRFVISGEAEPAFQCGCTRRPGEGTSAVFCPTGTGLSSTSVIGPAGGYLYLSGTPSTRGVTFAIEIRRNAVDSEVTVRITETTVPPPDAIIDSSPMYYLEPADLVLNTPAVLEIPWQVESGSINPMTTYLSSDDPCTLEPLDDDYQNAGFQNASTSRFGWLVVGSPRDETTAQCP